MSEIEKMYENIGVEPIYPYTKCYPDFTSEKQIEILKLLCQRRFIELGLTPDDEYFLYDHGYCQSHSQYFEEAVAKFVSMIWQDLTEDEKQQIKEILK